MRITLHPGLRWITISDNAPDINSDFDRYYDVLDIPHVCVLLKNNP